MKMKRWLRTATFLSIILIFCADIYGETTHQQFVTQQQNNMIELCEDAHEAQPTLKLYECILLELYALNVVTNLIMDTEVGSEEWVVLNELLEKYSWPTHNTHDFMAIHREFELHFEE